MKTKTQHRPNRELRAAAMGLAVSSAIAPAVDDFLERVLPPEPNFVEPAPILPPVFFPQNAQPRQLNFSL